MKPGWGRLATATPEGKAHFFRSTGWKLCEATLKVGARREVETVADVPLEEQCRICRCKLSWFAKQTEESKRQQREGLRR